MRGPESESRLLTYGSACVLCREPSVLSMRRSASSEKLSRVRLHHFSTGSFIPPLNAPTSSWCRWQADSD